MDAATDRAHGTFPGRLAEQARRRPGKIALREKKYGIWQQVTWSEYAAHVRAVALGLEDLGLRRGDTVAVVCGNRPAWLYVELATQSIGAIPLGIYVDALPDQLRRVLEHSEARVVLAEDQEQADKVLGIRASLPHLASIIVDDMRGLERYDDPMLTSLEAVQGRGRALDAAQPGRYERMLAGGSPATWPCCPTRRERPATRRRR